MKRIFVLIAAVLITAQSFPEAAQVIGEKDAGVRVKLGRDLNILESVLNRELKESELSQFRGEAVYMKGQGLVFSVTPKSMPFSDDARLFLDKLDINIPEMPELPDLPQILRFEDKDGRVKVIINKSGKDSMDMEIEAEVKEELEKARLDLEESRKEIEEARKQIEQHRIEISTEVGGDEEDGRNILVRKRILGSEFTEENAAELNRVLEHFFVNYVTGLRNLDKKDRVILYITLPEDSEVKTKVTDLGCGYDDIRDFRREKKSEKEFTEIIRKFSADMAEGTRQEMSALSSVLWQWAVEDPDWMFSNRSGGIFIPDGGYLYSFSNYMVGSALKSYKVMAKGLWYGKDDEKVKSDRSALVKEQAEKREAMIGSLLETLGGYGQTLKVLPDRQEIIVAFEMSDSRYGLEDATLTVRVEKKDLMDFYREKTDLAGLRKKASIEYLTAEQ